MKDQDDFKSQIISAQKPSKQRAKARRSRNRVDLIGLHKSIVAAKRQRGLAKSGWAKSVLFALIASPAFFLLGYMIVPLLIPIWAKILLLIFTAALGFILSHFLAALLH